MKFKPLLSSIIILSVLTACGSSDKPDTSLKMGKLSIALKDAPIDSAEAVVVEFTGVEIQGQGERVDIDFDSAKSIDLMQLTGTEYEVIVPATDMAAGQYQWIRLKVNAAQGVMDSYIDIQGDMGLERHSLYVPSGTETGLKLNRPFIVAAGAQVDFTIDFDLRKSVHKPESANQDYKLRPTLRIVNNIEAGHIEGTVAESLINAEACTESSAVYLFAGSDAIADDVDGSASDPITTALVELNPDTSLYQYQIGYVVTGDYSLAFTCQASSDDPEVDDPIEFAAQQNVSVQSKQTTTANFE